MTQPTPPGRLFFAACWLAAMFVCLALYWNGLRSWFQQDDFAWLKLPAQIESSGWARVLFESRAQGTIRPWSERLYYVVLYDLFGLDALPFRIVAFLTQGLNLWLLVCLSWKLSGRRAVALLAPILWTVNASLAQPMSWSATYNQILLAAFLLGAVLLFLKYLETGERRWYAAQFGVFVLGFGALEINVVYPALVATLAWAKAPRRIWTTLPMWIVSIAYAFAHRAATSAMADPNYGMRFDSSLFATLGSYVHMALGGWTPAVIAITVALLYFTASEPRNGNRLPVMYSLWFLAILLPVLPLRDHITNYYLVSPTIALALLMASALTGTKWRALALILVAGYAIPSASHAWSETRFRMERSRTVRNLAGGVRRAAELHPGKVILLDKVGDTAFWGGVNDGMFPMLGIEVYLTPGSETEIISYPSLGDVRGFVLPLEKTRIALSEGRAVAYSAAGSRLRNITTFYKKSLK
jgi:hypothetical protein